MGGAFLGHSSRFSNEIPVSHDILLRSGFLVFFYDFEAVVETDDLNIFQNTAIPPKFDPEVWGYVSYSVCIINEKALI